MWTKSQRDFDDRSKRRPSEPGQNPPPGSSPGTINPCDTGSTSAPSSPNKASGQREDSLCEPQLPVKRRKLEERPALLSAKPRSPLDEASTAAALDKAIKSSPHKFTGTKQVPIEVGDLTPHPTRRILFPSPTSSARQESKSDSVKSRDTPTRSSNVAVQKVDDKENQTPAIEDDDIDRFFNEDAYAQSNSRSTLTPFKSKYPFLKRTPKKSPNRRAYLFEDPASPSKGPTTPKRTPSKHTGPLAELTPFTAHLNQLLSDANAGSPGSNNFDFPTLPSLRNTPNNSRILDFDFSHFDSQDLVSTDVPMPSSPPPWEFGNFGGSGGDGHASLWGDCSLPNMMVSPQGSEDRQGGNDTTNSIMGSEKQVAAVTAEATA